MRFYIKSKKDKPWSLRRKLWNRKKPTTTFCAVIRFNFSSFSFNCFFKLDKCCSSIFFSTLQSDFICKDENCYSKYEVISYFLNMVLNIINYSERVTDASRNILVPYKFRKLNVCCGLEGSRFNSPKTKPTFSQLI